jgi:Uma2 family endonuclease
MTIPKTLPLPKPAVPPLEPGDRLAREEFERRYDAMPGLQKAELLDGVVHRPPAVCFHQHSSPHFDLVGWLYLYRASTPGVRGSDNGSLRLDLENMPQPDAALLVEPSHGGQAKVSSDDYIEGAPELVAEVSASSVSIDLNHRLRIYRRNQVREYVVWRVLEEAIDWFVLRRLRYARLPADAEGVYRSRVFPGLWLDAQALVQANLGRVLQVAQAGIASPEHEAFAAKLQRAAARRA